MTVTMMTKERFDALASWCRAPESKSVLLNSSYWSADNERILGTTYLFDEKDGHFGYVLLARDAYNRYQAFANNGVFHTKRAANIAIQIQLNELLSSETPKVPMRADGKRGVDLFGNLHNVLKLNPKFINLRDTVNASAARELLAEISHWYPDLDGNFVRDFQTTGFNGRMWELYLFVALKELDFEFNHDNNVPDFCLKKDGIKLFIGKRPVDF